MAVASDILIPFNEPFLVGPELEYIRQAVASGKLSGDGHFTRRCHAWLEQRYGLQKALLTTSCTDALEMAAILTEVGAGDEVIVPAFTFVSTANAFVLRGARIVFADVDPLTLTLDPQQLEELVTPQTKVVAPVHYAGVAADMDAIMAVAAQHRLYVVEDAAQGIEATYKGKPLGSIGHFGAFSFHETKNLTCGEGGALAVNEETFIRRAEIIREKGTNRAEFFRGETDKYGWQDIGSSFLPSELNAAYLYAQLEHAEQIQARRHQLWNRYYSALAPLAAEGRFRLPHLPDYARHNASLFYLLCPSPAGQQALLQYLRSKGILAVFHYQPLHQSPYFRKKHDGRPLPVTEQVSSQIVRLPLYYTLSDQQQEYIIACILQYFSR